MCVCVCVCVCVCGVNSDLLSNPSSTGHLLELPTYSNIISNVNDFEICKLKNILYSMTVVLLTYLFILYCSLTFWQKSTLLLTSLNTEICS